MMRVASLAALLTLVVNEVLYDPEGADSGHEFVEILNVSATSVALAGLELQVGDGGRPGSWRVAWSASGDSLAPGALLVVGGDSIAVPRQPLDGSLQNGPDAVRLWDRGQVLDLVGYGDLEFAEYFEGAPAPDVSGASLARVPDGRDTDSNAGDWRASVPSPGRLNAPPRAGVLDLVVPDPTRLWPFRSHEIPLRVRNVGTEAIEAGACRVEALVWPVLGEPAREVPVLGPPRVLAAPLFPALAAGDSATRSLIWHAELGLWRLQATLHVAAGDSSNNTQLAWLRSGAGAILMREILFAPVTAESEWIEIHNRDSRAQDLDGWTLADATGRSSRLRAAHALAPGAYAILSADTLVAIAALAPGTLRVAVSPWPALNNSDDDSGIADRIVLRDRAGIVQDAVVYSAAWGAERGRSIERLTDDPDARGLLWSACKDRAGSTPGRANSASAPPAWSVELTLAPNPFSPNGDGLEDLLLVAFEVPVSHSGFEIGIYDTTGRRRRLLAGDRLGPGPRRLSWDGGDDAGAPLVTGAYVLRLELLGARGSPTQLRTVGLVRH